MLILLLAALSDPAAAPVAKLPPPKKCERANTHHAGDSGTAGIRPLSQEPAARGELAVAYSEAGCLKPVLVLGGNLPKLPKAK